MRWFCLRRPSLSLSLACALSSSPPLPLARPPLPPLSHTRSCAGLLRSLPLRLGLSLLALLRSRSHPLRVGDLPATVCRRTWRCTRVFAGAVVTCKAFSSERAFRLTRARSARSSPLWRTRCAVCLSLLGRRVVVALARSLALALASRRSLARWRVFCRLQLRSFRCSNVTALRRPVCVCVWPR